MSDKPQIKFEAFANAACLKVPNSGGRDCVIIRAEGFNGTYTEHDVVDGAFAEMISPENTYKYGCAFLENAEIGRREKGPMRNYIREPSDPPVTTGSFSANEVEADPPIFTGTFNVTLTWL